MRKELKDLELELIFFEDLDIITTSTKHNGTIESGITTEEDIIGNPDI